MIFPVQYCRHWDVAWEDSHTCHCQDCGRQGQWFEDGYVLWTKRPPAVPWTMPRLAEAMKQRPPADQRSPVEQRPPVDQPAHYHRFPSLVRPTR